MTNETLFTTIELATGSAGRVMVAKMRRNISSPTPFEKGVMIGCLLSCFENNPVDPKWKAAILKCYEIWDLVNDKTVIGEM